MLCVLVPLTIGFYAWQIILRAGLNVSAALSAPETPLISTLLAQFLIWGSPILALAASYIFMRIIHFGALQFELSRNKRARQQRIGLAMFCTGFIISIAGIIVDIPNSPYLAKAYQPLLEPLSVSQARYMNTLTAQK
jgi:hypothetical protein